jgi:hypothetical protein
MIRITLTPLEERCARVLAEMRGTDVNTFLCDLVRYEAAQELSNWQGRLSPGDARAIGIHAPARVQAGTTNPKALEATP